MNISASRITLYNDCSLKYKFRYVDKIRIPASSPHLAYGSALHKALEYLNLAMLENKEFLLEDFFQMFEDSYKEELKLNEVKESDYFAPKLYKMGLSSIEQFYNSHKDYEVVASEFLFTVPLPKEFGGSYNLTGIIDAIIKQKSKLLIVDYKTAKEQYPKFMIDTSLQLSMYSYAFRHILKEGRFDNIKKDKEDYISYCTFIKDYNTLTSTIKIQKKSIKEEDFSKLFLILRETLKSIENNIYIPNYSSMCKWCEYKKNCLEYGK